MKASALKQDLTSPYLSSDQLPSMTGDSRNRKPRNGGISESPRPHDIRREITESRAEHDRNFGLQAVQPLPDRSGRGRRVSRRQSHPSVGGPCRALITTRKMAPGSTEPE